MSTDGPPLPAPQYAASKGNTGVDGNSRPAQQDARFPARPPAMHLNASIGTPYAARYPSPSDTYIAERWIDWTAQRGRAGQLSAASPVVPRSLRLQTTPVQPGLPSPSTLD